MSITGKGKVTAGEFEMNLTAVEAAGAKCGERGTVQFTPNAKAKNTNSLKMLQIVKVIDASTGKDYHWSGGEAPRNQAMTAENHATAAGVVGGALGGAAIGGAVAGPLGAAVGGLLGGIAGGIAGSQNQVEGGYFVDHQAASATPRTNAGDAAVSPYYRSFWPNASSSQDGWKKSAADIQPCSLWDFPGGANFDSTFKFETAAKGEDNGVVYGTVKWQFSIAASKIKDESFSVHDNPSATFNAAVDQFNELYKNPGASTAPAATPPASASGTP